MTTAQGWVSFVGDVMTDVEISRQTGIPRSTVGFVHRGERDLPEEYTSVMRNLYQRTAYSEMRDAGASTDIAKQFSWYSPTQVSQVEDIYDELTSKTAFGVTLRESLEAEDEGSYFNFEQRYNEVLGQVIANYQQSAKDWEDISAYVTTQILGEEGFEWETE